MPRAGRLLLLTLLLAAGACHGAALRTAGPGTAAPLPALRIENQTDRIMVVSYEDGRGTGVLGSVRAGRSQRFVLADVAPGDIEVSARSADGSVSAGPFLVRLARGATARVIVR